MTKVGLSELDLAELIFSQTDDVLTWYRLERVSRRFRQVGLRERKFVRKKNIASTDVKLYGLK